MYRLWAFFFFETFRGILQCSYPACGLQWLEIESAGSGRSWVAVSLRRTARSGRKYYDSSFYVARDAITRSARCFIIVGSSDPSMARVPSTTRVAGVIAAFFVFGYVWAGALSDLMEANQSCSSALLKLCREEIKTPQNKTKKVSKVLPIDKRNRAEYARLRMFKTCLPTCHGKLLYRNQSFQYATRRTLATSLKTTNNRAIKTLEFLTTVY